MKRVRADALEPGMTIQYGDWRLHIRAVDHERGTALGTAELDFMLHLSNDKMYDVIEVGDAPHGYYHETEDDL